MPETPIYGFPFEHIDDVPGHSLRSPGPILAEAVESEISRVDTGFRFLDVVVFDQIGSHGFSKIDFPGIRAVYVRVQAGGGGGGATRDNNADQASSSGGGAGGQYVEAFVFENQLLSTETVTVGDGGDGGTAGGNGQLGDQSSFGSHAIAQGGPGGFSRGPSTGFRGSTGAATPDFGAAVGDVVVNGSGGFGGFSFGANRIPSSTADQGMRGTGGQSHLGGHTRQIRGHTFGPSPGTLYGGGGAGRVSGHGEDGKDGGDGRQGIVVVEVYV